MKVKIKKLRQNAIIPKYQTKHSAGMDLCASLDKPVKLAPGERTVVPTGISIALQENCEAQIRSRSGLAAKYGVSVANSPGTIDADYRGEVGIILINLGNQEFVINNGDRIAQMVISKYDRVELEEVNVLNKTERGTGGFGSTGE